MGSYSSNRFADRAYGTPRKTENSCLSKNTPPWGGHTRYAVGSVQEFKRLRWIARRSCFILLAMVCWSIAAFSQDSDAFPQNSSPTLKIISIGDNGKGEVTGEISRDELRAHPGSAVPWQESQDITDWRLLCGVHAMFVFLQLCDVYVELDELRSKFNVTDSGVDMLQLKTVASEYGIDCQVVQCSADELRSHMPAIALMSFGTNSTEQHFDVVTHLDDTGVSMIEPSSGRYEIGSLGVFTRHYALHALIKAKASSWYSAYVQIGVVLCEVLIVLELIVLSGVLGNKLLVRARQ